MSRKRCTFFQFKMNSFNFYFYVVILLEFNLTNKFLISIKLLIILLFFQTFLN